MRNILISLAVAASTVAVAAPASAQWAPRPAYGYGVGNFQRELQQLRYQTDNLRRQGRLTRAESNELDQDIRHTERSLYRSGRDGMSPWEARTIQGRIAHIQGEVRQYADYDRGRRHYRRY